MSREQFNETKDSCFVEDIEILHNERLIQEREEYENSFFIVEDILKSEEWNFISSQYESMAINEELNLKVPHFENDLQNPFEFEDFLLELRDEKLIGEREEYEANYFAVIDENLVLNDIFDLQIKSREEDEFIEANGYDYDFKYEEEFEDYEYDEYEEKMFWELFYLKQNQFKKPNCKCIDLDYMPHDDGFYDYLDCYDYPEGPDENLCGIKF